MIAEDFESPSRRPLEPELIGGDAIAARRQIIVTSAACDAEIAALNEMLKRRRRKRQSQLRALRRIHDGSYRGKITWEK